MDILSGHSLGESPTFLLQLSGCEERALSHKQHAYKLTEELHRVEADTATLEHYLEKLVLNSTHVIECGKNFDEANKTFKVSLDELAAYSRKDDLIFEPLSRFSKTWSEMISFHNILIDQMQRSVKSQITKFLKSDIKTAKDLKKSYDKATDDYYGALARHSAANKHKQHEVEEAETYLGTTKMHFHKTGMNYVFQINALHGQKKFQIVDRLVSFMHAVYTYFHQGYELFKDLQPYLKRVADQLEKNYKETKEKEAEMKVQQERHQMIGDNSMFITQDKNNLEASIIQGHLFKRASNAFKSWNRRWFVVKHNKLCYIKKYNESTSVVDDLRLCSVKYSDELERRFCFEVISPAKLVVLQADSEDMRQAWVQAIQTSINDAFKETMKHDISNTNATEETKPEAPKSNDIRPGSKASPKQQTNQHLSIRTRNSNTAANLNPSEGTPTKKKHSFLESKVTILAQLANIPGNKKCADCKKSDPRWASVNLGLLLCIECSGVHRSLGVQVSKVRSLTLDSWDPDVIQIMTQLGNERVNEVYEANLKPSDAIKPSVLSQERVNFIKSKYIDRRFAKQLLDGQTTSGEQSIKQWTIRAKKTKSRKDQISPLTETSTAIKKNEPLRSVSRNVLFAEDEINSLFSYFDQQKEENNANGNELLMSKELYVFGCPSSTDLDGDFKIEESAVDNIENLDPNILLYRAARLGQLPVMILARANGANINWHNDNDEGKTALMQATILGSIPACEYLLLNGAKINEVDNNNRSALHYATLCNNTGIACQFLKRKILKYDIKDKFDKTPLQIAVDSANADIVTLIRLKKMNDEMLDSDPSSSQSSLFTDVFHDFSQRAASSDLPSPNPLPASHTWPNIAEHDTPESNKVPIETGLLIDITDNTIPHNTTVESTTNDIEDDMLKLECESSV